MGPLTPLQFAESRLLWLGPGHGGILDSNGKSWRRNEPPFGSFPCLISLQ